jgi:hypothetical protein
VTAQAGLSAGARQEAQLPYPAMAFARDVDGCNVTANDPDVRLWLAHRRGDRRLPCRRSWYVKLRFEPTLLLTGLEKKGGTNLRVCLVTLQGNGKFEITQSKYRLTEDQKQEEGQKLFDFCAQCLKTFIDTNLGEDTVKDGEKLPLGFTVSS